MKAENEWLRCPKCKGDMVLNPYDKKFKCEDCGHVLIEKGEVNE